jgi:hypothetical protein
MKHFVDICLNIRIATGEIGGTVTVVFLMAFGMYKAWPSLANGQSCRQGSPFLSSRRWRLLRGWNSD